MLEIYLDKQKSAIRNQQPAIHWAFADN